MYGDAVAHLVHSSTTSFWSYSSFAAASFIIFSQSLISLLIYSVIVISFTDFFVFHSIFAESVFTIVISSYIFSRSYSVVIIDMSMFHVSRGSTEYFLIFFFQLLLRLSCLSSL